MIATTIAIAIVATIVTTTTATTTAITIAIINYVNKEDKSNQFDWSIISVLVNTSWTWYITLQPTTPTTDYYPDNY